MPTMDEMSRLVRRIEAELEASGTEERAEGEKRYLKSDLEFFGCRLADIRRISKTAARELDTAGVRALATELWSKPNFERRMSAVVLLEQRAKGLDPGDLPLIQRLIGESETWALVDGLAVDVLGEINAAHRIKGKLDIWARDDNFWIRRSSLLAEIKPLKGGAPFEPFAARADRMLDESEFFIRKAIGWVLREMSKRRPDEVYAWTAPRTHRASGVTMREVVKYLDPKRAERLMRAYKAGRPAA
jgi:3-methyladenine DNA glycosylase AlkD